MDTKSELGDSSARSVVDGAEPASSDPIGQLLAYFETVTRQVDLYALSLR